MVFLKCTGLATGKSNLVSFHFVKQDKEFKEYVKTPNFHLLNSCFML